MDDLISRQAAIEAMAKAMPQSTTPDGSGQFDHEIHIADEAFVDAMQIIHDLPSAQPEIIRCKECKYSYVYVPWDESPIRLYCEKLKHHYYDDTDLCVDAEGFCYLAEERKTDE